MRFCGGPVDDRLADACSLLRHRGPDHWGTWAFQTESFSVSLGAARLAVLDPRAHADQPLHRNGRHHLVYNGELYNFRELREELTDLGERFVTEGDTEVVLTACARWGTDALSRLDGMFALAFFDSQTRSGFLARDPRGIKPLFYAVAGSELFFASELRALTRLGAWRKDVDAGSVLQHLVFGYIDAPATMYRAAWRLAPGQVLSFGPSGISEPRGYFERVEQPFPAYGEADYPAARVAIRRAIGDAVARQRVADVPVGAFLSGGLDSSIVVSHLAEATPGPVHTFCVGYADAGSYDESGFARVAARAFGTHHEEVIMTESDVLAAVPRVLDHLGEPFGDSSIIPSSLISAVARRFVTVALSGDGGDELFGGYWRYLAHQTLASFKSVPAIIRKGVLIPAVSLLAVSRASSLGNRARQFRKMLRAEGAEDALRRHVEWSRILPGDARSLFLDSSLVDRAVQSMLDRSVATPQASVQTIGATLATGRDPLDEILRFDLAHQLPSDMLHKVDLASMMHSLEVRVPLLDSAVVNEALRMPSSFKIHRGLRKRILVDAYRGRLPDEILDRPKQGFEVPVGELLRGPLRGLFHDIVRAESLESFGLINARSVERLFNDHLHYRADYADLLWALLSLCWWQTRRVEPT